MAIQRSSYNFLGSAVGAIAVLCLLWFAYQRGHHTPLPTLDNRPSSAARDPAKAAYFPASIPPPWELKSEPTWARIYIDASGSMKGFVGRRDRFYERVLNRLPDVVVGTKHINLEVLPFGAKVLPPAADRTLHQFATDPKAYSEVSTYLPAPIEHALAQEGRGVTVVVTDGVASSRSKSENSCGMLSDTACLARRMLDYVQRGHGLWIIGIRMPFHGVYWVEEGSGSAPSGTKLNLSVDERPVYMWIGTPDAVQGREIVSDLMKTVSKLGPSLTTMAMEIAPGDWERWRMRRSLSWADMQAPPKTFCPHKLAMCKAVKGDENDGRGGLIEVEDRNNNGSLPLRIPVESNTPDASESEHIVRLLRLRQVLALQVPTDIPNGVAGDVNTRKSGEVAGA